MSALAAPAAFAFAPKLGVHTRRGGTREQPASQPSQPATSEMDSEQSKTAALKPGPAPSSPPVETDIAVTQAPVYNTSRPNKGRGGGKGRGRPNFTHNPGAGSPM